MRYLFAIIFCHLSLFSIAQTQLVTNGTFATDLSGWTTSGNVGYSNFFSNGSAQFSGEESAVNGIISQTISATPNATLTVSINFGKRGGGLGTAQGLFEILDATTNAIISTNSLTVTSSVGVFTTTTFTIVAPVSGQLLIKFTDLTTSSIGLDFYINTISITQPMPLPVELLKFEGSIEKNKAVKLEWTTESEINNNKFVIEKSQNSFDWLEFTIIKSEGNSNEGQTYFTMDNQPFYGKSFYRLKQIDFDGKANYLKTISVFIDYSNGNNNTTRIYPNPSSGIFNYQSQSKDDIKIYDISGKDLTNQANIQKNGSENAIINIQNFEAGNYFIITNSNCNKIVKQ